MRAYHDLFVNLGFGPNYSNGLDYLKFSFYYIVFSVNLNTANDDSAELELIKCSSTTLYMYFKKPLPEESIQVIVNAD